MNQELLSLLSKVTKEEEEILSDNHLNKGLYTDTAGFVIDNKKMLANGKMIAIRPHTRFVDFPVHTHNYIEIMYVCKGQLVHTINNQHTVHLQAGELLFLNCNTYHAIRSAAQEDVAVNFIVLPQFFDKAHEMIEADNVLSRFLVESLRNSGSGLPYLHFQVADILPIQNIIENLIWSILHALPNRRNINQTTMGLLFMLLLNHTERLDFVDESQPEHKHILAVFREIENNYQSASLSKIAEQVHLPMVQLSKLIKAKTGQTFKEILQEKRFSKAIQLLESTNLSVVDIAQAVGYENMSYFHRQFRSHYTISPASYRKRYQNQS